MPNSIFIRFAFFQGAIIFIFHCRVPTMVEFFGGDLGDSGRGHWLRLFETHSQQEEGSYFRSWQKRREAGSERRVRNEGSAGAWECLQGKGIYF